MQQCRIVFQPVSHPKRLSLVRPRPFLDAIPMVGDAQRTRTIGRRKGSGQKKNTRDNPDGIALALPFRASVLGGDDGNLVGDGAFGAGGIVGGDNEEVGGTALGQLDGGGGGLAQVAGQGVIAAGETGVQFVADGIGVGVGGRGIGIPG